jgi:hypothetical protein
VVSSAPFSLQSRSHNEETLQTGKVNTIARESEEAQEWELFIDVMSKQCGSEKNKNQNKQ